MHPSKHQVSPSFTRHLVSLHTTLTSKGVCKDLEWFGSSWVLTKGKPGAVWKRGGKPKQMNQVILILKL